MKKVAVYLSEEELLGLKEGVLLNLGTSPNPEHYHKQDKLKIRLEETLATFEEHSENNTETDALVQSYCADLGVSDGKEQFTEQWNKKVRGES
jgi:hypothetical protein